MSAPVQDFEKALMLMAISEGMHKEMNNDQVMTLFSRIAFDGDVERTNEAFEEAGRRGLAQQGKTTA